MTQRTRRATEAVEAHLDFLAQCRMGSEKDMIEGTLLDVTRDPADPRFGHGDFLYEARGGSFQTWMASIANQARTFTATTDLWREVTLTVEMMTEEGIDWLPLTPEMLPAEAGFMLFPYGVKYPYDIDRGHTTTTKFEKGRKVTIIRDDGGGAEWWIDGLLWLRNDRVASNGWIGPPVDGVTILPLTRWRGDTEHRPYRLTIHHLDDTLRVPELVASDITAWGFDQPGVFEWTDPAVQPGYTPDERDEELIAALSDHRTWIRSLVWATFRWLNEEVWLPEQADNRGTRRRLERAKPQFAKTPDDGDIVVVDLRKERREQIANSDPDAEPPWWRTRWIVHGHYARRRYAIRDEAGRAVGPTTGPDAVEGRTFEYRRVWIEPFLKGPENAPLVIRDHVGVLNR